MDKIILKKFKKGKMWTTSPTTQKIDFNLKK